MDRFHFELVLNPISLLDNIARRIGLPRDHLNFVLSELIALSLSPLFRTFLHPSVTKASTRQAVALVVGIFLGYFAFGIQALHLVVLPTICYLIMRIQSLLTVQRTVMVVSLLYLSLIHLHRLIYDTGSYALDVTGPLMVMTQKATSLAFCLHDGFRKEEDLNKNQKYYAIRKMPTLLEYFSYMLQFHTLMVGPLVFYRDYIDFMNGNNVKKHQSDINNTEPSPFDSSIKKILTSVLCACVFTVFVFPMERAKSEEFIERSIMYQTLYLAAATTVVRFKYYHAWVLADAICNLSGLGFNGYDENNKSKWDLISNVDILEFELSSNLRNAIASWNKGTNAWLRMVAYERVKSNGVLYTFALSAIWHGFYPGYYLTFATGALFTVAARSIRSNLRPLFQSSDAMKLFYDVLTTASTRIMMGYLTFSFVLLEFWPSVRIYWNMYFWIHLVAFASIYLLPRFLGQNEAQLRNRLTKLVTNSNGVNGLQG